MVVYERERIEFLVPGVFDEWRVLEAQNDLKPDPSMPKARQWDPRRSTDRVTELADIQRAWHLAPLTHRQRQAVLLRFGLDYTYDEVAEALGLKHGHSAMKLCDRGIDCLGEFLNGRPYPERQDATTDS